MARTYGKIPRRMHRLASGLRPPRSLRVRIRASADLEDLSLQLQKMVARLQDGGVHSIASGSLYLNLRDASGNAMALHDDERRPIAILDL